MKIGDTIKVSCYGAKYRVQVTSISNNGISGKYNTVAEYRKHGYLAGDGTFTFESMTSFRMLRRAAT